MATYQEKKVKVEGIRQEVKGEVEAWTSKDGWEWNVPFPADRLGGGSFPRDSFPRDIR
jgi:hypothetical protein